MYIYYILINCGGDATSHDPTKAISLRPVASTAFRKAFSSSCTPFSHLLSITKEGTMYVCKLRTLLYYYVNNYHLIERQDAVFSSSRLHNLNQNINMGSCDSDTCRDVGRFLKYYLLKEQI